MASIQQRASCDTVTCKSTRLSAFDASLVRQQTQSLASTPGDVILQAEWQSGGGGEMLITLGACEALDLAKQLIASASGHLKKSTDYSG